MTGLYSMLIGFIVGAIIGKFIAPTVLECMAIHRRTKTS